MSQMNKKAHGSPIEESTAAGKSESRSADRDRRLSSAYFGLESMITDLLEMAKIASQCVYEAVGELEVRDGQTVEAPSEAAIVSAMFSTTHLQEMTSNLLEKYYAALDEQRKDIRP